jgi:hypothetical protein
MPKSWSDKDERMYDHIRKSERESGKSTSRAKEIAARSVNKQRRQEGRTDNSSTQGTGNPQSGLEDRRVEELRNRAAELDISGRSKMNKEELIKAIRKRN